MKNFIRGMGVGILITTIVLGTAYMLVGRTISDSEVKERAKKLGMVEEQQNILKENASGEEAGAQNGAENDVSSQEAVQTVPEEAAGEEQTAVPEVTAVPEEQTFTENTGQQTPDSGTVQEQTAADVAQAAQPAGETVSVTINRGQDGISVSRMLQEKGVVADAFDFNRYLSENRLQMDIMHGTFELEKNMDYGAIVQKIVRK